MDSIGIPIGIGIGDWRRMVTPDAADVAMIWGNEDAPRPSSRAPQGRAHRLGGAALRHW